MDLDKLYNILKACVMPLSMYGMFLSGPGVASYLTSQRMASWPDSIRERRQLMNGDIADAGNIRGRDPAVAFQFYSRALDSAFALRSSRVRGLEKTILFLEQQLSVIEAEAHFRKKPLFDYDARGQLSDSMNSRNV